jgi:hypothetical protein
MVAATETAADRLPSRVDGRRPARRNADGTPAAPPPRHLTDDELRDLLRDGTPTDVADVLLSLPEANRRALAAAVRSAAAHAHPDRPEQPEAALLIAGAACLPEAEAIGTWLRSRRFHHVPSAGTLADLLRVLTAPGRPRPASVAAALTDRLRTRAAWPGEWPITAAVLHATGTPPPTTEAVVRAWIRGHAGDPDTLADRLAADPWLDRLLPHLFGTPGLDRDWPPALARLAATGRLDRAQLIRLTLHRLRGGGTPAALRPAAATHDLLAPTPAEAAKHRRDYRALLDGPHAELARRAREPRPETETPPRNRPASPARTQGPTPGRARTEPVTQSPTAPRRPKPGHPDTPPGAHPSSRAESPEPAAGSREPGPEQRDGEDQRSEPTVTVAEQAARPRPVSPAPAEVPRPEPERALVVAAGAADSVAVRRSVAPRFPAAPVSLPADGMPPPIGTVTELVAEFTARLAQPLEPVSLERLLAGVVALAHSDRDEVAAALAPLSDTAPAPFGTLFRSLIGPGRLADEPGGSRQSAKRGTQDHRSGDRPGAVAAPLAAMVPGRVRELARQLATIAPPALLATPATTDGLVSPVRVLFRLIAAERDGWQPGPYDLAQALLRLPAAGDPTVQHAADRLVSPAGRQFAAWLRAGGLPPVTATVAIAAARSAGASTEAGAGRRATFVPPPAPTLPHDARPEPAPAGVSPLLHDAAPAATVDRILRDLLAPPDLAGPPGPGAPDVGCWPMILPRHREVVAAHCLAVAQDDLAAAETLPALARAAGPFGPAMALALARGLISGPDRPRAAAVEAVLHLAGTNGLDSALLGRELRALLTAGNETTAPGAAGRAADSLRRIGAGRAWHVVWAVSYAVVPALLRCRPVAAGVPDLLAVAADAAAAIGARADLPDVVVAAADPGRSDLAAEAARLARIIRGNA